jgi:serine/threonine-protein kinase
MTRNAEGTLLAGRYRIVRQLGQGGMGSVWLAEDTQLDNKQFAIKMLPSILVSNKRAYRQLKDEALVAMKLTHPNIVTLRAFEENNGNPFLVMDYIDGQTLDDYLAEKGKLSEDETIRLLKPIAAALDYAHGEGVVHRDVKPANVMIRKDGHPYILDFGIAREIQETMTRVTGKLSSGTLLYMSPEQLNGEKPTPAQDIYSFAAMVYECLKGEPPFVRGAIEDQIKNKLPEPLRDKDAISISIMAGLAKKPEGRPVTCVALIDGIFDCTTGSDNSTKQSKQPLLVDLDGPYNWNVMIKDHPFSISSDFVERMTSLVYVLHGVGLIGAVGVVVSVMFNVDLFDATIGLGLPSLLSCIMAILANYIRRRVLTKIKKRLRRSLDIFARRNWVLGRRSVEKAFEKDPYIQYFLGVCLMYGFGGCNRDIPSARECFHNSALAGVPEALCALGYMDQHGIGGGVDIKQAIAYYHEANNLGCTLSKLLIENLSTSSQRPQG